MLNRQPHRRVVERLAPLWSAVAILSLVGCGIAAQPSAPGNTSAPRGTQPAGTLAPQSNVPGASTVPQSGQPTPVGVDTAPPSTAQPTDVVPATPQPTTAGTVSFGNWPLYIDIAGDGSYPTLNQFTTNTGIHIDYHEAINDNTEFFGKIQPDLAAGNPTGYDVIVPSDWMVAKMIRLGYLQPLDKSLLPNYAANGQDLFKNPWYDPDNTYSVPWQAGIVGIGYNPTLTGRDITSFDDLFDPAFAGQVGLFSEMIDTMSMTLLSLGVKPQDATIEDVTRAQQKLLTAAQSNQFRAFYGNDYYDALAAGNVALTMAWSGDISQMQLYDNPNVKFVVPDTGGMLFVDNMVIPNNVEHPADAYQLIDYWYTLAAAVPLTEYIGYFSPVKGVQEQVAADAAAERAANHPIRADRLDQIAHDSFPDPAVMQNVYNYKQLTEDEERQWNELFDQVVNG